MKTIRLNVTTATDGTGTSNLVAVPGGGLLYAVQCVDGNLADGVDLTLTSEQGELSIPLLTVANFNIDTIYYPRVAEVLNTDGSALGTYTYPFVYGSVKAVVAQGGAVTSGSFILYIFEM